MRKSKPENAGPCAIKDLLAPMRDAVEAKAPSPAAGSFCVTRKMVRATERTNLMRLRRPDSCS